MQLVDTKNDTITMYLCDGIIQYKEILEKTNNHVWSLHS